MFRMNRKQGGQAIVETAIVMPLNVFLILAIIQFGLISQARYMTKYAAYRAARVGAMNHADVDSMRAAAQAALLPVMTMPHGFALIGQEEIAPTTDSSSILKKALKAHFMNDFLTGTSSKMVDVIICGPVKDDLTNITHDQLVGQGDSTEVDFDDPRATFDSANNIISTDDMQSGSAAGDKLKKFEATKLRVQVKFYYRMPIPFANWAISRMYLGVMTGKAVFLGDGDPEYMLYTTELGIAHKIFKIYIAPIFESYAMRMQSNIYTSNIPSDNQCVTWGSGKDPKTGNTRSP